MTAAADLYPSLRDRVVVVTGGGRALGLEMALAPVERLADTDFILLAGHFPTPVAGGLVRRRVAFRLDTGD